MGAEFKVRCTDAAREDLSRLFDYLLDRAKTVVAMRHQFDNGYH